MDTKISETEKQKETIGRTFWDFFNRRPFLTIIIIISLIGLIVFGFLDIKIKDGALIISANSNNIEMIADDNDLKNTDWIGNWQIGWRYDKYFDNQNSRHLERDLEFKIENNKLIGEYTSQYKNREVKTQLFDFKIKNNTITGKYKGYFTDSKNIYETGIIELLMFSDKKYFIGKYKRTKPNTFTVDGNYRLWYGRK